MVRAGRFARFVSFVRWCVDASCWCACLSACLSACVSYRTQSFLAVNTGTGQTQSLQFTGSSGQPDFIAALLATTAIQGVFPLVANGGAYLGDGGVVLTNDVFSAAQLCRDKGYADSRIKIDTVGVAGAKQPQLTYEQAVALYVLSPSAATNIAQRVGLIQQIDSLMAVLDFYREAEPGLFRLNLFPSSPLPGNGFQFNPLQSQVMIDAGIVVGQNAFAAAAADAAAPLPAACNVAEELPCGNNKDCFNYNVEKCGSKLSEAVCDHDSRACVFKK